MAVWLTAVAVLWGSTNPFIKRGSKGIEDIKRPSAVSQFCAELWFLLTTWKVCLYFGLVYELLLSLGDGINVPANVAFFHGIHSSTDSFAQQMWHNITGSSRCRTVKSCLSRKSYTVCPSLLLLSSMGQMTVYLFISVNTFCLGQTYIIDICMWLCPNCTC